MKTDTPLYDVAIVGGGLAGLSLSILLARKGLRVVLFEKEIYPFHKVCGEYISMESWDFLQGLGLPLDQWNLPMISELLITATNGVALRETLPLGGFGISRYKLDAALALIAREAGVELLENTRVLEVSFDNNQHELQTSAGTFQSRVACAGYGKKSNLDVRWKRDFTRRKKAINYVGVKYHVRAQLPTGQIALHNFPGGYCGISRIEDGRYCLCYLTQSNNLHRNQQSISLMEENILKQNPFLRKMLDEVEVIYAEPLTIAQISFSKKSPIENHVIFVGDAAGMITPLCGNGMSMALHGAKIASEAVISFFQDDYTRDYMEINYSSRWKKLFSARLRTGRLVQLFFGNAFRSSWLIRIMKPFPFLIRALIRQTHGEKF